MAEMVDRVLRRSAGGSSGIVLGVIVPMALFGLAWALWWVSDRLLYVGPLDRAAFGWIVVVPVWVGTPIVAGFIWQGLPTATARTVALVVATVVGALAAGLLWLAVVHPTCDFGAIRTPTDWIPGSLFVGAVVGAGVGGQGLVVTSLLRRGMRRRAIGLGAVLGATLVLVDIVASAVLILVPVCNRPPA